MNITLNGQAHDVADGSSVADIVAGAPTNCAVAVNGSVVPKSAHADTELHTGDKVEVVTAVAGG